MRLSLLPTSSALLKDNFITPHQLPPHASHKIQPLGKCFFARILVKWLHRYESKVNFEQLIQELPLEKDELTFMSIAIQTFSDKDFAPSDTTCRSEEHHENLE
jgi:hypothetical protein